jgi:hypothetical protein
MPTGQPAESATLLFVPLDAAIPLLGEPAPVVTFGPDGEHWRVAGLSIRAVGSKTPMGYCPKSTVVDGPIPHERNRSARLAIRVALDVLYRVEGAVRPPDHLFFSGAIENDVVMAVESLTEKAVLAAATYFSRRSFECSNSAAQVGDNQIVLVVPTKPRIESKELDDFRDKWDLRYGPPGKVWDTEVSASDGRLTVRFSPPPADRYDTAPEHTKRRVYVQFIVLSDAEDNPGTMNDVWRVLQELGGEPVAPQTPPEETPPPPLVDASPPQPVAPPPAAVAPRPSHPPASWVYAAAAAVALLVLTLLASRRSEGPSPLPVAVPGPTQPSEAAVFEPRPSPVPSTAEREPKPEKREERKQRKEREEAKPKAEVAVRELAPASEPAPRPKVDVTCPWSDGNNCPEEVKHTIAGLADDGWSGTVTWTQVPKGTIRKLEVTCSLEEAGIEYGESSKPLERDCKEAADQLKQTAVSRKCNNNHCD